MRKRLLEWLARADPAVPADVIFVLAGLKSRKVFAIQLLHRGIAPRVLFSVGRFEIRRFPELGLPQTVDLLQIAQSVLPPQRHFFVLFENQQVTVQRIPVRALGTLSEIDALADWLKTNSQISSLLIVSSGPHLRRLRVCCRVLLPRNVRLSFVATPPESAAVDPQNGSGDTSTRKMALSEYFKIACYLVVLPLWELARPWRPKATSTIALN
jgi:hypothetical protein